MNYIDPQQSLFTALLLRLREKYNTDVYDTFLPPKGTPYPFIYLGDSTQDDDLGNKTHLLATVTQSIDIYHDDPQKRGTVSTMLNEIKAICYDVERTNGYQWAVSSINQMILPDNTTETPLLHGRLMVTFRLLGGQPND